jgi:hypothetical protein
MRRRIFISTAIAPQNPGRALASSRRQPDDLKRVLVLQAILLERCEQELTSEQADWQ